MKEFGQYLTDDLKMSGRGIATLRVKELWSDSDIVTLLVKELWSDKDIITFACERALVR